MTHTTTPDGRLIAAQNDHHALYWIHRFGGMTTRQLGRLAWPDQSAGLRSAQRTLRRLTDTKYVERRAIETGGYIYLLTWKGARQLIDQGVKHVHSRGQSRLRLVNLTHRMIANEYVIDMILGGHNVWTEHEIQRGLPTNFPDIRTPKGQGKIPDALIKIQDYYRWIEVEHAPKKRVRIQQILSLAEHHVTFNAKHNDYTNHGEFIFHSLIFVVPNETSLRSVLRQIKARNMDPNITGYIYLDYVEMSSGLVWKGSSDGPLSAQQWFALFEQHKQKI